ncbi:MAG: bacterial Ig-like domain-containing protein, partial [Oscillospiraceae bacterium]|nr:bacterial Ig-like domain-containing protein [Oscillospiraceae bacterium]
MKQESTKKNNKLFLWIGIAAVLVAVGVLLAVFLPGLLGGEGGQDTTASKVYWNADRLSNVDPETGLSSRVPGEDGLYHILFAVDGEQVELACADKKLVNKLDLNQLMGLVFDDNGHIIDMISIDELVGKVVKNVFVQKVSDDGFATNSSAALNGMEVKYKYNEQTKIYDVSDRAEKIGEVGELAVMDKVTVLQDEEGNVTHVFIVEAALESRVYWRTSAQRYDYTAKKSTRLPDADGYYTYEFFVDGQYVTLRTNRMDCVDAIDGFDSNLCAMGLVFDDNGMIVDVFSAARAAKGTTVSSNWVVMSVNGDSFSVEALTGSNQGKTYEGFVTENTKIYDMTGTSDKLGVETTIREQDAILAYASAEGELLYVFVTKRIVDAPVYLLMNRSYSSAKGETNQVPDEDGWYVFDVVAGTKRFKVRTKDRTIANAVHAPANQMVGLRLEGDVVVGVYNATNVTGGKTYGSYHYVNSINGPIIASSYYNGSSASTGVLAEDCKVYLVGYNGTAPYKETTLQVDDRILALTNVKGEISLIYVYQRNLKLPVYWNTDGRKYSAAKEETTRVPDEEGYYVYNMTTGGKRPVKLKTKDKKIANWLDKQALTCYALKVDSNGIIKEAYSAPAGVGGQSIASWYVITSINGNRVETQSSSGTVSTFDLTSDYKCYNISTAGAWEFRGEKTTPKVGDKVHGFTNRAGKNSAGMYEVPLLYVVGRENKNYVVGWKVDRKYSSANKETTRVPDADGYYVYQMAVKGEIKTYKTKDKEVADFMDSQSVAVAMNVKNGIIIRAYTVGGTNEYGSSNKGSWYTIMKIDGNKVYTQSSSGKEDVLVMEKKYECYDVSFHNDQFGAKAKFKVGDKIHAYYNQEETGVVLMYIVNAYVRQTEVSKPCPHCGETVLWSAFGGTVGNGHYYLAEDREAGQISIGEDANGNPYDFVLDMNGYDFNCTGKAFLVWKNSKVYIYDSTGYDFTVTAKGPKNSYHSGVIQMMAGELTLIGGNYVFDDSNEVVVQGGVMSIMDPKAVVNATGVDFVGGTLVEHQPAEGTSKKPNVGGTIAMTSGTANFKDCTFTGGVNPTGNGGNLYVSGKATFDGCTITGGKAVRGGAIAILDSKTNVTMTNTVVTGGKAASGGGVFVYKATATFGEGNKFYGNTLENGKTPENLWVSGDSANVTLDGVQIPGGAQYASGAMTISGNTVIDSTGSDALFGLKITNGSLLNVGKLGDQAKIGITASGVFTKDGDIVTLTDYVNSGKLFADDGISPIVAKVNALSMGIIRCINGHTDHTGIDCDEPIVSWKYWNQKNAEAASSSYVGIEDVYKQKMTGTGNWILIDDLTLTEQRTTGNGTLRIDLNGHTITRVVGSSATTNNARAFYVYDAKTGEKDDGITPTLAITDLSTEGEAGSVKLQHEEGVTTLATGALVYAGNGPFTLAGRAVLDGSNLSAIAVYAVKDVTMYGGTVKGGTNDALRINKNSANVALKGDVKIEGIANLKDFETATIEGNVQIENLMIPEGKKITLGQLGDNAKLTVNAFGTFTTEGDAAVLQSYLDNNLIEIADNEKTLTVKDNALSVVETTLYRCLNGHEDHEGEDCTLEILEWKKWKEKNSLPATGNWILAEDVTLTSAKVTTGDLRIDLNGHNIIRNITAAGLANIRVFTLNGATHTLAITDLSTEGEAGTVGVSFAQGVQPYAAREGVAAFVYNGSFILAGRAVLDGSNVSTTATSGGATVQVNNAGESFIMYGGTIKGVEATGTRSSAIHSYGGSNIAIHGGLITSEGTDELAVYEGGNFTMDGGKIVGGLQSGTADVTSGDVALGGTAEITGGVKLMGCTSATLAGAPKIDVLENTSGKLLNVTGITGGMVFVKGNGVFTTDFPSTDAANAATAFIKAAESGKTVTASGLALTVEQNQQTSTLTGITVTAPTKTEYEIGETLDLSGMVVTGQYDDSSNAPIAGGYQVTGFDSQTAGQKTVTVSYEGFTANFIVTVNETTSNKYCINGHTIHEGETANCPEEIVTWEKWTETSSLPSSGNVILTENVTLTSARATGGHLRIDLNGHNITRNITAADAANIRVFTLDGDAESLSITDLSTQGEAGTVGVSFAQGVNPYLKHYGVAAYVYKGTLKLAGRAVLDGSSVSTTATTGGATVQLEGANRTFIMYGGTIKGLASTSTRSSALHGMPSSSITIHGGEITSQGTDELAAFGGGNFTMDGGKIVGGLQLATATTATGVINLGGTAEITGGVKIVGCTSATLAGAPKIDVLENTSGKLLNVTGITGGNVAVKASGVFTTDFANATAAEAATAFISAAESGKVVTASGAALQITDASDMIHCINGHASHDADPD